MNFEWKRGEGVWTLLFPEVTPFEHIVLTILSPIVEEWLIFLIEDLCFGVQIVSYRLLLRTLRMDMN